MPTQNTTHAAVIVSCETCGKEFSRSPSQLRRGVHHYCSASCRSTGVGLHATGVRHSGASLICEQCGHEFWRGLAKTNRAARHFCSDACRALSKPHIAITDAETRFWEKVQKSDGCWLWVAGCDDHGYGDFMVRKGRLTGAHRFSWELANGPIPDGLCVLHSCDNPPCVNPAHLFLGTRGDNADDKVAKGRSLFGERNTSTKLTESQVIEIRRRWREGGVLQRELAEEFGVNRTNIIAIVQRKSWKHLP